MNKELIWKSENSAGLISSLVGFCTAFVCAILNLPARQGISLIIVLFVVSHISVFVGGLIKGRKREE